ncbi:MAG TPA: hypothetical protein VKT82_25750 [Ktedonobacterales bacterium]|nr:hypothetical protein [Ktedonobacterales bacterium]
MPESPFSPASGLIVLMLMNISSIARERLGDLSRLSEKYYAIIPPLINILSMAAPFLLTVPPSPNDVTMGA